jgi:replicative DNA helicase
MTADQGGALPPHNADAEQHLLGALFLHPGVLAEAQRWMAGRDLFFGAHRRVWDACEAMQEAHGRVSLVLLRQSLVAQGMTDDDPEDTNTAKVLAGDAGNWAASCEDYTLARMWAQEIEALAIRRRMISAGGAIATAGYDKADADDAVRQAYQILGDASERRGRAGEVTLADTTSTLYDRISAGETGTGLPTGLPRIDRAQRGLRPGELTVLAARTAHGKTALALQVARRVAGAGSPVAVLSLEMDAESLTERLVSAEAGVNVRDVLEGRATVEDAVERVVGALGPLSSLPVTFAVSPGASLPDVRRLAGRWADVGMAHLLIVDYLQLVSLGRGGGNRAYEVGAVAQALRDLAQQHQIHVLALAQLNRSVEHRSDPTPVLADLRESGGIEQAADAVWLLHRPALFGDGNRDDPAAFVHLAKNRAGPLAHEPLLFDAPTTAFRLLDEHHAARA